MGVQATAARLSQESAAVRETSAFKHALSQRRKVEALFGELKNQIGLRRLRLRASSLFANSSSLLVRLRTSSDSSASTIRNLSPTAEPRNARWQELRVFNNDEACTEKSKSTLARESRIIVHHPTLIVSLCIRPDSGGLATG